MGSEEKNSTDLQNVELKMPEENFLGTEPQPKKSSFWVKFLLILIVLLMMGLAGALWWFKDDILNRLLPPIPSPTLEPSISTTTEPVKQEEVETVPEPKVILSNFEIELQAINKVSESDEVEAIESDFNNTDLDGLDEDFQAMEEAITPPSSETETP